MAPAIYHVTHFRNLEAVLDAGYLEADGRVWARGAAAPQPGRLTMAITRSRRHRED
jgi:hypothetical protein